MRVERYILNQITCETKSSHVTFEIYEMNCKYSGPGIYKFEGHGSTKVLIFDRITDDAHLRVRSEHLEKIVILSGTETTCDLIKIEVNGVPCVRDNLNVHLL